MTAVTVVDHPVLAHRLAQLRDRRTGSDTFRQLISEVSGLLAYEALRDLGTDEVTVDTPVAAAAPARLVAEVVLLVPILRAGLGMVQAIQEIVPLTEVAHVGLRRDEATLRSEVYLNRLPGDLTGRRVIVCDPMLATGGSLGQVCELVRDARRSRNHCPLHRRLGAGLGVLRRRPPGRARLLRRRRPGVERRWIHRARAGRRRGPSVRAAGLDLGNHGGDAERMTGRILQHAPDVGIGLGL